MHRDDPDYIEEFKTREQFRPLRNKQPADRAAIIANLPELHPMKIADLYLDNILDDLFRKFKNFAKAPHDKQRIEFEKVVQEYVDREKKTRDELRPSFAIGAPDPNQPDPDQPDPNNE